MVEGALDLNQREPSIPAIDTQEDQINHCHKQPTTVTKTESTKKQAHKFGTHIKNIGQVTACHHLLHNENGVVVLHSTAHVQPLAMLQQNRGQLMYLTYLKRSTILDGVAGLQVLQSRDFPHYPHFDSVSANACLALLYRSVPTETP
jgi:hypothetical protein